MIDIIERGQIPARRERVIAPLRDYRSQWAARVNPRQLTERGDLAERLARQQEVMDR
ncbi:hypothetical protein [Planotetraspora sp. GP83]|uniref:hypothetical protein n=1 Tax=Planotetraspora sp. GP83 TaxID=3156264 RepID=UPI003516CF45